MRLFLLTLTLTLTRSNTHPCIDTASITKTLATNYHGLLATTRAFLPLMRWPPFPTNVIQDPPPLSRIVNLASLTGRLTKYPPSLAHQFRTAPSTAHITALMDSFAASAAADAYDRDGWPRSAYAVSKAGVIGLTRALAREEETARLVSVTCCCPGFVRTELTKGRGRRSVEQGAKGPVELALGKLVRSGGFWMGGEEVEW